MSSAVFIPIKSHSERVKGKNFLDLNGKPLYSYIISNCLKSKVFSDIYVDTDSDEIKDYCSNIDVKTIDRKPELALNSANGNDLLCHHRKLFPQYEFYFQAFCTAPLLRAKTIKECSHALFTNDNIDSVFTATTESTWFWMEGKNGPLPVNYRPSKLPRSQDAQPLIRESTGLYGVKGEVLKSYGSRVGHNPLPFIINKLEGLDIDDKEDLIIISAACKELKIK